MKKKRKARLFSPHDSIGTECPKYSGATYEVVSREPLMRHRLWLPPALLHVHNSLFGKVLRTSYVYGGEWPKILGKD